MKNWFPVIILAMLTMQLRAAGGDDDPAASYLEFRHHYYHSEDTMRRKKIFKGRGYCGILELGFADAFPHPKDSLRNNPMIAINYVIGGHVTPWYSMGIALGFSIHSADVFDLELTGDFRFQFGKRRRLMPFLSSPGGYLAHFQARYFINGTVPTRIVDESNGFIVNPSVGVRYAVNHRFAVSLALGYRMTGYIYADVNDNNTFFELTHGLTLKGGINF